MNVELSFIKLSFRTLNGCQLFCKLILAILKTDLSFYPKNVYIFKNSLTKFHVYIVSLWSLELKVIQFCCLAHVSCFDVVTFEMVPMCYF